MDQSRGWASASTVTRHSGREPSTTHTSRVIASSAGVQNEPRPIAEEHERCDGQRVPENLVLQPGPELEVYIAERAERVANRSVRPEEDNILKISTDARKAALDVRMVGGDRPNGPTKIDAVAHQVLRI